MDAAVLTKRHNSLIVGQQEIDKRHMTSQLPVIHKQTRCDIPQIDISRLTGALDSSRSPLVSREH